MNDLNRFRGKTYWLGDLACPVVGLGDDAVLVKVGHQELWLTPDQLEASKCATCPGSSFDCQHLREFLR